MIFKSFKGRVIDLALLLGLLCIAACSSEGEEGDVTQHLQAHLSKIVSIEIDAGQELILRTNQTLQFQAYGLLSDGSRLQTDADSEGNTTDQTINDWVDWSVDNSELAQISSTGLLSNSTASGSVLVIATFSGQEATANVVVTDAELVEIIIDTTVTDVEVCRNLQMMATGVLSDGNEVSFESDSLIWTAQSDVESGEFKDETLGELSTFLAGSVSVTAQDSTGEVSSEPVTVTITGGLDSITLSNTNDNTLDVGASIEITAMGAYPDGDFDITGNTVFISRDDDVATFAGNVLTARDDAALGTFEITGSCDISVAELSIEVVNSSR